MFDTKKRDFHKLPNISLSKKPEDTNSLSRSFDDNASDDRSIERLERAGETPGHVENVASAREDLLKRELDKHRRGVSGITGTTREGKTKKQRGRVGRKSVASARERSWSWSFVYDNDNARQSECRTKTEREREGRAARELRQREKDDEEEKDGDREGGIEGVASVRSEAERDGEAAGIR